MDASRLPVYLEIDNIKDSIITLRYSSNYNVDFMNSIVLPILQQFDGDTEQIPQKKLVYRSDGKSEEVQTFFYTNSSFKVQVNQSSIAFNCVGKYNGWAYFSKLVSDVINGLNDYADWSGCQIRYISFHENVSIFDELDGTVELNRFPRIDGSEINFSFSIPKYDGTTNQVEIAHVTVRLKNNLRTNVSLYSVVDISLDIPSSKDDIKENLSFIHNEEKKVFFSLLSKKMVDSLKPHYHE